MRVIHAAAVLAALAGLGGCTDDDFDQVARPSDWHVGAAAPSGPPVDCIDRARVRGTAIRDDRTIDFAMEDGSLLRNRLPFACPGLMPTTRFTYRTALPRLCSTDQITLAAEDGRAAGICGLGMFQPVAIAPTPAVSAD